MSLSQQLFIRRYLRFLTERQRQAIELYLYGYKQREIADLMRIRQQNVSRLLLRGMKKIKKIYERGV